MAVKSSRSSVPVPYAVEATCRALGERIGVARRRRRLTQKELAHRAGLSTFTVIRIEKGVASTEVGSIVRVLWAMGLERTVELVAELTQDEVGQASDRARLPRRVSRKKGALDDDF